MEANIFWKLIDRSIREKDSVDKNGQGDRLMEILGEYPTNDLVGFHKRAQQLSNELDTPMMGDIAFMMGHKDNPTAYQGFRNWIISLGKEHYEKARVSPAHLLSVDGPNLLVARRPYFPDLDFVASGAYYERADGDIPDWEGLLRSYDNEVSARLKDLSLLKGEKQKGNEQDFRS